MVVTEDCVGCPHSEDRDDGFVYCGNDKCVYEDVEEDETNCLTEAELEEIRWAVQILNKYFNT